MRLTSLLLSALLAVLLAVLLAAEPVAAYYPIGRYRRHMAVGADGEDERVAAQKLSRRPREKLEDPHPPMLDGPLLHQRSRSYHYRFGPTYPSHHAHLKYNVFPPKKNQLLYP